MRLTKILVTFGLILPLAGCDVPDFVVGSMQPAFNEQNPVFEPALVGTWVTDGKEDQDNSDGPLKFEKSGENAYKLISAESANGEDEKYDAHLARIGEFLFLDFVPEGSQVWPGTNKFDFARPEGENKLEPHRVRVGDQLIAELIPGQPGDHGDSYELRFIKAHWFCRISIDGDVLRLAMLDPFWLKKAIDEEKVSISHEPTGSNVVLTASTRDLQEFLRQYGEDEEAFPKDGTMELHRQK